MTIWIILPLWSVQIYAMPEISADCGRLEVQGYNSCEIIHNNNIITYKGPTKQVYSDRRRFGLITYTCDHKAAYFISEIECKRCNFKCSTAGSPQEPNPCPADPTQFWAGLFLGIFTAVLICGLGYKRAWRALHSINKNSYYTRRGSAATIYKDDKVFLQSEGDDGGGIRTAHSANDNDQNRGPERSPKTKRKRNFMTVITGLLMLGSSDACDVLITVDSGNVTMVCHESLCAPQASFPVRKGQEICIENHQGQRVSMEVIDILSRVRYGLSYYTSDYSVSFRAVSNCCTDSDETNCWDKNGNCHRRAKEKIESQAGNATINYQCLWSNVNKLYTNCAYFAKTERRGDLYEVLKKREEIREIKLSIQGVKNVTLSELNPTRDLDLSQFKIEGLAGIPISLVGSLSRTSPYRALLKNQSEFYYVNGSERGDPKSGMIGDFQMTAPTASITEYAEPVLTCESPSGSCNCRCSHDQISAVKSFQSQRGNHSILTQFVEISESPWVIDAFESHEEDEMLLLLGNGGGAPAQRRGKCHVDRIGKHSCTSCENPPSVVFGASEIEKVGLVPVYSNCSFDRYMIKCDEEPTELVLRGNPDTCYLRIPALKQEFYIDMKYYALGKVQPERKENCTRVFLSIGEALEHLVTSSSFIWTFLATVILIVVSATSLLIVFKMFQDAKRPCTESFVRNAEDLLEL